MGPWPVWMGAENLTPLGLDPWTVQPVVSNYTNYTTLILTDGEIPFEIITCRPNKLKKKT